MQTPRCAARLSWNSEKKVTSKLLLKLSFFFQRYQNLIKVHSFPLHTVSTVSKRKITKIKKKIKNLIFNQNVYSSSASL